MLIQGSSDFEASNKIAGLDFRLWLPEAGAVLYGDTDGVGWLTGLMREKRDVSAIRDALAFGPEAAAALLAQRECVPAASLPPAAGGQRIVA